jgi:hypothetical protein
VHVVARTHPEWHPHRSTVDRHRAALNELDEPHTEGQLRVRALDPSWSGSRTSTSQGSMIVGRFEVHCQPDRAEEVAAAIAAVETPSRQLPGGLGSVSDLVDRRSPICLPMAPPTNAPTGLGRAGRLES